MCSSDLSNTGRTHFKKGHIPWITKMAGSPLLKQSKETIEKRMVNVRGEKHWNWKGGISTLRVRICHYAKMRKARKENAEGAYSLQEWEDLKKQFNYICPSCFRKEPKIKLTADHIIPLVFGGFNYIDNIQPLCFSCNSSKKCKAIQFPILNYEKA